MELTQEGIEHRYTLQNRPVVGDKLDTAPALGPGHTMEVSRPDTEPTQQVSVPPAPKLTIVNGPDLQKNLNIIL